MRIRRETRHGGADGVDGDAEQEDAPAPHEIAGAPSGDEDHAEGKRITRQHPLHIRIRGTKPRLDRRQCHVHDGHTNQ